jgi:membrane protein YqaA with SNARE-associated domain
MKGVMAWVKALVLSLGAPGLFVAAFLDSSFLSLPEINDLLIVMMVIERPDHMILYVALTTLGSIVGCLTIYALAWKGGEAFLEKRLRSGHVGKAAASIRRYGVLALLVPSILPPPSPFKVFVLLAGVVRIPPVRFTIAIAVGRGFRYLVEGLLAVWYGRMALTYVDEHANQVALWTAMLVLTLGLLFIWWHRRRQQAVS